ncbi:MAG: hypothetical protein ACLFMO_02195 [Eubacteriales bacterium]
MNNNLDNKFSEVINNDSIKPSDNLVQLTKQKIKNSRNKKINKEKKLFVLLSIVSNLLFIIEFYFLSKIEVRIDFIGINISLISFIAIYLSSFTMFLTIILYYKKDFINYFAKEAN